MRPSNPKIIYACICCCLFYSLALPRGSLKACEGTNPGCSDECGCDADDTGDSYGGAPGKSCGSAAGGCPSCGAVNHVIKASGNLYLQLRPFKLDGHGVPIEPVLTYNSEGNRLASPYGRGWQMNYQRRLRILNESAPMIPAPAAGHSCSTSHCWPGSRRGRPSGRSTGSGAGPGAAEWAPVTAAPPAARRRSRGRR